MRAAWAPGASYLLQSDPAARAGYAEVGMTKFITAIPGAKPPLTARPERRKAPRGQTELRMGKPLYRPAFSVSAGDSFEAAVPGYN